MYAATSATRTEPGVTASAWSQAARHLVPHMRMCKMFDMPTNLAIDDRLLEEAQRIGGHRTKKATVTEALEEYVQRRKQARILELFGKVDFDPKHNYKKQRNRS